MMKEEEKKGIPGGAKPHKKSSQRRKRISRKIKLEYRLLNNGFYCLRFVFIFRWIEKYRLVVIHNNQVWTDKYYKSKKYTPKAFERMYKNRPWKKEIKPEWSTFYPPGTTFALEKVNEAYKNTPFNKPLFPEGTARKNRHVRDVPSTGGEARKFSGRLVSFREGPEIFRGGPSNFGEVREIFGVARNFSGCSGIFRRGSGDFRGGPEFFGVFGNFSERPGDFREGPSGFGEVRLFSERPGDFSGCSENFRGGPSVFGEARRFSGRSVRFRRGPSIFGKVRQVSERSVGFRGLPSGFGDKMKIRLFHRNKNKCKGVNSSWKREFKKIVNVLAFFATCPGWPARVVLPARSAIFPAWLRMRNSPCRLFLVNRILYLYKVLDDGYQGAFLKNRPLDPQKTFINTVELKTNKVRLKQIRPQACRPSPERLANPEREDPAEGETLPKMSTFLGNRASSGRTLLLVAFTLISHLILCEIGCRLQPAIK